MSIYLIYLIVFIIIIIVIFIASKAVIRGIEAKKKNNKEMTQIKIIKNKK
tara:strand:- start:3738 stop:3887 length:150 start_codon:yes stop_codon:yes gene_type:complete